jgi:membrane associated rhomboid family serine protease
LLRPGLGPGVAYFHDLCDTQKRMDNTQRLRRALPIPATLVYGTALTCGILAAIAAQIELRRHGFELVSVWENRHSAGAIQLRTTGPWWAIAGIAFIVSGATAGALSRASLPWRRFRLLRWVIGALIVFLLGYLGQHSAALAQPNDGASVFANLIGLGIAGAMGWCGAYLTARR